MRRRFRSPNTRRTCSRGITRVCGARGITARKGSGGMRAVTSVLRMRIVLVPFIVVFVPNGPHPLAHLPVALQTRWGCRSALLRLRE